MVEQENTQKIPSALVQAFRETQARQKGDSSKAMEHFQSLLKDKEIHAMLKRLANQ